ncbi:MAG: beta-ketoacyl-ACP synthase II [Rickettsiales bacterium]|jgi:3-oxoacyl-[acyl-carrier-protein] synthase II|nr:beta-ketoacyl-ACP synthase II [Rickettsiales bacterium]
MRKVVVTGMGIVSPVGTGVEHAWKNIIAGKSGIGRIERFDASDMPVQIAGSLKFGTNEGECDVGAVIDPREARRMDLVSIYAIIAADEAIKDAKLETFDSTRAGVAVGSGIGGVTSIMEACETLLKDGPRKISPFFVPKAIGNMPAGQISMKFGLKGPNISIVTACATGTHCIGESARMIGRGDADIMICGGTEAGVCRIGLAGFAAMHALSTRNDEPEKASRPWDKNRDGFVMGEGAGILVLEEYERAKARGAKIYAEVAGFGMSSDAHHITAPPEDGEGGLRAMKAALTDANLKPTDIDYINAHGTSTGAGDLGELAAAKTLFAGTNACMSSTKSMTGHLMGAAGAIEAIFSVLAIRDGIVPPTINLDDPVDEAKGFDLVPNKAERKKVGAVLSNSFGFGGTNASIIFKKI